MSVRRRASGRVHYNYFRDYDPAIGKYVESDPIGLKGGVNTYAYVGDNPVSRIDPKGLLPLSLLQCFSGDECEEQAQADEQICRNLPNTTKEQKAVRSRCWASVQERYGACKAGRPIPPLITYRVGDPLQTTAYSDNPRFTENPAVPPATQGETTAAGSLLLSLIGALAAAAAL